MQTYKGYVVIRIHDDRSKFWTGRQWSLDPGKALLFEDYRTADIVARWRGARVHEMTTYDMTRKRNTKEGR